MLTQKLRRNEYKRRTVIGAFFFCVSKRIEEAKNKNENKNHFWKKKYTTDLAFEKFYHILGSSMVTYLNISICFKLNVEYIETSSANSKL